MQNFQALGALPSGPNGLRRLRASKTTPPHCEFLATRRVTGERGQEGRIHVYSVYELRSKTSCKPIKREKATSKCLTDLTYANC